MTRALIGQWGQLDLVAVKAACLFLLALLGLRVAARRTLAELSVFDFVTAVAVGAIVGRVPNASATSFVAGATTLVVLLALHHLVGRVRATTRLGQYLDHRPVPLVRRGEVDGRALRQRQLSREDLASLLRMNGVTELADAEYVIFEPGGAISVVRAGQHFGNLVESLLDDHSAP